MSKKAKRLQKISRRLTTHQLRRLQEKDVALGYGDLFDGGAEERSSPYFLGYYSPAGIQYAMEQYGFFDKLREKGYDNFKFHMNIKDPYKQCLALYYDKKVADNLLAELVVKRKHITVYPPFPSGIHGRNFEVIAVEWLCMQHPKERFTPEKPRLPGQKYPGLGLGYTIMEILVIMSKRLRTAGLLNIPDHFHNAQMYSREFHYLEPVYEAKRRAIARDLLNRYSLSTVAWAIDLKCIRENGHSFEWQPAEQVIPIDRDLRDYFDSKEYIQTTNELSEQYSYSLDEKKWEEKKGEIEISKTC
jgi:hypothetical protein